MLFLHCNQSRLFRPFQRSNPASLPRGSVGPARCPLSWMEICTPWTWESPTRTPRGLWAEAEERRLRSMMTSSVAGPPLTAAGLHPPLSRSHTGSSYAHHPCSSCHLGVGQGLGWTPLTFPLDRCSILMNDTVKCDGGLYESLQAWKDHKMHIEHEVRRPSFLVFLHAKTRRLT